MKTPAQPGRLAYHGVRWRPLSYNTVQMHIMYIIHRGLYVQTVDVRRDSWRAPSNRLQAVGVVNPGTGRKNLLVNLTKPVVLLKNKKSSTCRILFRGIWAGLSWLDDIHARESPYFYFYFYFYFVCFMLFYVRFLWGNYVIHDACCKPAGK